MDDFINIFGYEVAKRYDNGNRVEYRGTGDVDRVMGLAKNIIAVHELPVRVVTNQSLAQIRGFQVEKI